MDGTVLANNSRIACPFDVGAIILKTCLYSTLKSIMISVATFVLGGLAVLSAMGPLHFVLGEPARYLHQQCIDEGFEGYCAYDAAIAPKYLCKKLVCARKEGGVMIATDTGKRPDDGTACTVTERADGTIFPIRVCINGSCRPVAKGMKPTYVGLFEKAMDCWTRQGQPFEGGPKNRAAKCPHNP